MNQGKGHPQLRLSFFKEPIDISEKIGIAIHPYNDYIMSRTK